MRAADAQTVAAKLLDFYREPARHRPRYLSGQETIDGSWVIKFAQSRFPHTILRSYNLGERATLREAAHAFIRQVCLREAASHFDLLCVRPDAKPEAIKENYHLLMALLHPDRQGAVTAAWPTDCAQRVNQAYAVLSEERARRGYEANLPESATRAARAAPPSRQPAGPAPRALGKRRRRGLVRAAVVVSAVMAALLLVQLLWVSHLPAELGLLERSYAVSGHWMRGAFATSEQPRYLSDNAPPARPTEIEDAAPPVRPARSRDPSVIVLPDIAPPPARPMTATILEPVVPAKPAAGEGSAPNPEAPAAKPSRPLRVTESIQPAATQPSAQAISTADVEMLIARLVSYYESGDLDNLMALLDRNEAASLRGAQMRQAYRDFFEATRQRRLRLSTIAWQLGGASAQARGEAALSAEYFEQPAVERRVSVELDIALRDGRPRITRLALFPNGM
jgi:hypothetical protein